MEGIRNILVMVDVDLVLLFLLYIAVLLADLAITLAIPQGIVPVCFQLGLRLPPPSSVPTWFSSKHLIQLFLQKIIRLPFGDAVITSMKITFRH